MYEFREWYNKIEWWNSSSETVLEAKWLELRTLGLSAEDTEVFLDSIINVMRNEYGD